MAQGIQRSVVLTEPQRKWIIAEAKRLGISDAEVIRRAIDEVRAKRG